MMNFTLWDELLREYVNDRGQVDYARWQRSSVPKLEAWLASMQDINPQALPRDEAIALFINLYNALTIRQVLQRYPIDSIRPKILGIPNWWAFWRFFTRSLYQLDGQSVSLNAIEHDSLRARFAEPRIHFALVCASAGCPWLRAGAYWPDRLDPQLDEEARRFVQNPEKVRYDAAANTLHASKIFKWYGEDFRAAAGAIAPFINRYRPDAPIPATARMTYLPYSWQLNDQRTSS